ncbi:MAG: hypothetical protein K2K97_07765 [Muribaculaceae bacterium]|nr:hypothetical protein [Muribaculaceae bacterium]
MKKKLLFVLALAASTLGANADELTIDFVNQDYGLKRENSLPAGFTMQNANQYQSWEKEISFTADDISLSFKCQNTANFSGGYLLTNNIAANQANYQGLVISGGMAETYKTIPEISVTALNGGKISSVTFFITGQSITPEKTIMRINETDVECDGTVSDPYFLYSPSEEFETATLTYTPTYYPRFIKKIVVYYKPDLGGKQECGLSFNEQDAQAVLGETFTAPTLNNPNNLPITWSSSDEEVATVAEDGAVTLTGAGQTKIKAETAGNDEYAKGYATYTLTVIGAAANIPQMMTIAPAVGDQVKINFPMTVTYANSGNAFVIDAEGNATYIHNTKNDDSTGSSSTTIYKVGQIIPAGWIATNNCTYEIQWNGLPESGDDLETTEVTYPEVTSINYDEDNCKVLILKDVTFAKPTPGKPEESGQGTTPDGSSYTFQGTYTTTSEAAGTYDATVVVRKSNRGNAWLAIVSLEDLSTPEFPESFNFDLSDSSITAKQGVVDGVYTISVSYNTPGEPIVITLEVPTGWDGFIGMSDSDMQVPDINTGRLTRAGEDDEEWASISDLEAAGMKTGNTVTLAADGDDHTATLYLYKGDQAYMAQPLAITAEQDKPTNVDVIDADSENARYYSIDGTEVANPANGLFIRVASNKATKVIIK